MRLLSCLTAFVTGCAATFVPNQRCDNGRQPGVTTLPTNTATQVKLEAGNGTDVRLSLDTITNLNQEDCEQWAHNLTRGTIELEAIGRSTLYHQLNISGCRESPYRKGDFNLYASYAHEMHVFPPVSTLKTTVRLYDADSKERACLRSHITPALPPRWSSMLRYFPLGIFLFVLVVGAVRSLVNLPPPEDQDNVPRVHVGGGDEDEDEDAPDPQPVLPNVGDCLQYLQHIFLGASLSLFYPGFLIPVAGRLSWSSLFSGGILTYGHADYEGISDGIYERNGTYGGTFGLETMAQIVGAPATMGTWLNMVFLFTIVLIISAILIEAFWYFRRVRRPALAISRSDRLQQTGRQVLQVALSYFIVPLISLSVYQLIHASYLPLYHTVLAAMLIAIAIASLTWLFRSLPTRSLGVLLFNRDKQYSRMADGGQQADTLFVRMLFILNFIRGIAIGGLQFSGLAQIVTLAACEVILIICIAALQVYPTTSLGTITAVARLAVLLAMVAFVPGVSSDRTRHVVGYAILLVHACILVLGFLLQGVWDLMQLIKRWISEERPDVSTTRAESIDGNKGAFTNRAKAYGLHQLERRQPSRSDMRAVARVDGSNSSTPDEEAHSPDSYFESQRSPYGAQRLRPPQHSMHSTSSSRFYRPPRSASRTSSTRSWATQESGISDNRFSRANLSGSFDALREPSTPTIEESVPFSRAMCSSPSTVQEHRSADKESDPGTPAGSERTVGLGPRWNDYSFRESDLYYGGRPRGEGSKTSEDTAVDNTKSSRQGSRKTLRQYIKREHSSTVAPSKGFEVIRRPPPPGT